MSMAVRLAPLARRWRLGKLLYRTWHAPRGFLARCWREGPVNLWLSRLGQARMQSATHRLPRLGGPPAGEEEYDIHFLTGHRFWYQTCFCAYSMVRHSGVPLRPVLYDDGTLDRPLQESIRERFPNAVIHPREQIESRLDATLPAARYPALRARRLVYPHLRKLTDVHAGATGWKLVLDSDMLFFRRPDFLIDWLRAPGGPCCMSDVASAYGYPVGLMAELAGADIPERVNVGVCGLRSDEIDWDRFEFWCQGLLDRAGPHYYQEQALTAMLLAGKPCAVAPDRDYVALPSREESTRPAAVMHHYVAESKAWYFRFAWKQVLRCSDRESRTLVEAR
jgi:hypothetical protein